MYFWCICGEEGNLRILLLHHLEVLPTLGSLNNQLGQCLQSWWRLKGSSTTQHSKPQLTSRLLISTCSWLNTPLSIVLPLLAFCPSLWDPWGWGKEFRNASWVIQELLSKPSPQPQERMPFLLSTLLKSLFTERKQPFSPQPFPEGNIEPRSMKYHPVW